MTGDFHLTDHLFASTSIEPSYNFLGQISPDSIDVDALWERMYTKVKNVIVPCRYCKSHNAISNATCIQCGAPLGVN